MLVTCRHEPAYHVMDTTNLFSVGEKQTLDTTTRGGLDNRSAPVQELLEDELLHPTSLSSLSSYVVQEGYIHDPSLVLLLAR